jgi:hypothetical protein
VQQNPGEERLTAVNGADLGVNDVNFEGKTGGRKEGNGQTERWYDVRYFIR